jgi:hypothetical protein
MDEEDKMVNINMYISQNKKRAFHPNVNENREDVKLYPEV